MTKTQLMAMLADIPDDAELYFIDHNSQRPSIWKVFGSEPVYVEDYGCHAELTDDIIAVEKPTTFGTTYTVYYSKKGYEQYCKFRGITK